MDLGYPKDTTTVIPLCKSGKYIKQTSSVAMDALWLISTTGLDFGLGFLYYAGFSTGSDSDSNHLIEI